MSVSSEGLVALHRTDQLQLFNIAGRGIDLDYHDIEWYALVMYRDHSVIFQIASKYWISDSFVDYDGYSIFSEGFLSIVVDIMVIIPHASKVMLKILQAKLQQYVNHEVPDVQARCRIGRGFRDQIANICWIIKKQESSRKTSISALLAISNLFVDHDKLLKILKEMEISDYLTYLLRNLYAGQEATVRTRHGTTQCFQIGKGICQGCILSPCLFHLYTEYIMRNSGMDEAEAGIKLAGRNINNLRYADDTTLMA